MFSPFYNRIIRKMVVAFGHIFNEIDLIRYNNNLSTEYERIKVPLIYSPKEKFITRLFSDPELTRSINTALPRMGFEILGYTFDSTRKSITTLKNFGTTTTSGQITTQYVGVPYDMDFTLSIYTRNIEDGTQIIEQILPYFTPDYIVTINFIDGVPASTKDIPFILTSIDNSIEYESDFTSTRLITWSLNFTAKMFFFGPVSKSKLIMGKLNNSGNVVGGAIINTYSEIFNKEMQEIKMNTGSGAFKQNEIIRVMNKDIYGTVVSWSPNTKILLSKNWNETIKVGDVLMGDESFASWNVNAFGDSYVKLSSTRVVQDPLSAKAEDDFGFTFTTTEYPNA